MTQRPDRILEMVARCAPVTDRELSESELVSQRDVLFERIVSSDAIVSPAREGSTSTPRHRRPATVLVGVGAIALVVVIAVLALLTQSVVSAKAAGVAFASQGGYLDVTITDPSAPAASMQAAFVQHGLDITVVTDDASPSLVGTITFDDSTFQPIYAPEGSCLLPGGATRCQIGFRVPLDFSGQASIVVNAPTPTGQTYNSTNDAFAPGEVLHCSGLYGTKVAQAAPILQKLGLTTVWRTGGSNDPANGVSEASIEDKFINSALPWSQGTVMVWVGSSPPPQTAWTQKLDDGC
jgi:hypothetical protein